TPSPAMSTMESTLGFDMVWVALRLTAITLPVTNATLRLVEPQPPPHSHVVCSLVGQLTNLEVELAAVPGVVSIWYGPPGGPPAYARADRETHYAASMMKLAVLAGLYREHEAGRVTLDEKLPVHNEFRSVAPGAGTFGCRRSYDSDEAVWERLGTTASLRWLARRMIVRSSNLATNLILERIGYDAATAAWRASGAEQSIVARPIEDRAAADQGLAILVTAADVAA